MTVAHHHRHRPAGGRDERGALIVELAIVSMFLLTLFAGTYDFGQGWRSGLAANEAARTGARVGSARADNADADFSALSGVKAALASSGKLDDVVRVVVFQASRTDGEVPEACKTGLGTSCQVVTGDAFRTDWDQAASYVDATNAKGCLTIAQSSGWCPTDRINAQSSAQYYGVWVKLRHDYEFPILGDGTDVTRTAVMRLEPKV